MSTEKIKKMKKKLRVFWGKYERKFVIFAGILLVSIISFQLGSLQGQKWQQDPLVIEKVPDNHVIAVKGVLGESSENDLKKELASVKSSEGSAKSGNCMFVGSKNSDKYHKMDCRWATQIKSDNIVCFKSAEDAKSKGYVPASCLK